MSTNKSTDFIDTMGEWFEKFPAIPKNGRDTLAKIAPILALIFGILGILVAVSGLGIFTAFAPFAYMGGYGYGTAYISAIIYLVASVLMLMAYPGLNARKYKGWKLLFWSEVVNLIGGLLSMAILSAIVGALIGFYLLFQIRSYYK
jgi:hypothetical protein